MLIPSRIGPLRVLTRLQAAVVILAVAIFVGNVVYAIYTWEMPDVDAYWNAARRIRDGQPLYIPHADINAADVYRYAPWFAWAWVPLTYLPRQVVLYAWGAGLVIASLAVVMPLLGRRRVGTTTLALLLGGFLVLSASDGNVQPLVVAALFHFADRRSGPVWIALAATLKAAPILYVLVFLGRRQWGRAAATVVIAALLALPMLPAILGGVYTTDPGSSDSLHAASPLAFVIVAAASVVLAAYVSWRHTTYGWLAASVAVILSLPRVFPYESTFLFSGLSSRVAKPRAEMSGDPYCVRGNAFPTSSDLVRG
jgi:hypothetical protein